MSFAAYMVTLARNTSAAERLAGATVAVVLIVCIALLIYLTCQPGPTESADKGPATWYVERAAWLAAPTRLEAAGRMYRPAPLVVINHSAGAPCYTFHDCAAVMRHIQDDYLHNRNYTDGPYNFAVGTDGRVYEGRGWGVAGAHTWRYNQCALGVGFLGHYSTTGRRTDFTEEQLRNLNRLLERGVALGHLRQDYVVLGHRDLRDSDSPGDKLYAAMQRWPHYNRTRYANMTCQQIVQLDLTT